MKRRAFFMGMAAMSIQGLAVKTYAADTFPNRPITLVVPYAAGGNGDYTARSFGDSLSKVLGQSVIVENRAGGGGAIGANYVAGAKPDGCTLIAAAKGVFSITPNIVKVGYTIDNFRTVGFISETPMVLVVKKASNLKTLEDFVEAARQRPGKMTVGIGAMGSDNHVALLQLELATKRSFNAVAYRGSGPMLQDLLGGQIEVAVDQLTTSRPFFESGDLVPLAVLGTSQEPSMPTVPTIAKVGAQPFDSTTYIGLLAPRSIPEATMSILKSALKKALQDPHLHERFAKAGGSVYSADPGEFEVRVRRESEFIKKMIQEGKVQKE